MTTTLTHPDRIDVTPPGRSKRGWAFAGLGAGLAGIGSCVASGLTGAVYEEAVAGDAAAIAARLSEMVPQIIVFHTAAMVSALLLVVFAAGLRRQLLAGLGADSLLPSVASTGLLLVSVALLMGSGLTTEFVFGVADPDLLVPEAAAFFGHWISTIPWLWGGAGLSALAVSLAALRHGTHPRWLGWISLVLGSLTTLFAISPLQYMAGMLGPLWLTIVAAGLLLSRPEQR